MIAQLNSSLGTKPESPAGAREEGFCQKNCSRQARTNEALEGNQEPRSGSSTGALNQKTLSGESSHLFRDRKHIYIYIHFRSGLATWHSHLCYISMSDNSYQHPPNGPPLDSSWAALRVSSANQMKPNELPPPIDPHPHTRPWDRLKRRRTTLQRWPWHISGSRSWKTSLCRL